MLLESLGMGMSAPECIDQWCSNAPSAELERAMVRVAQLTRKVYLLSLSPILPPSFTVCLSNLDSLDCLIDCLPDCLTVFKQCSQGGQCCVALLLMYCLINNESY